ncbi:hypothetical protein BMS3Abin15_00731 [bacterium BMS3Abin15]|nr:hypothetical protein BMS3Abin15_00731 [bacterium BMS3Abin15]HDZ85817.1 hypothetical protein [Candidatus Moranbacteria bacterium]
MKKTIAILAFLGVFTGLLFFAFFPIAVDAAGIIPCGRIEGDGDPNNGDETAPCTLCHLIVGVDRIIDYGFKILVFVAIASIVAGGILYITSAGNEQSMEKAKTIIKYTFYGFAIVLLGWVIINYTMILLGAKDSDNDGKPDFGITSTGKWGKFECSTESSAGRGDGTLPGIGGGSSDRWKCRFGSCQPDISGTYNSKEECESSPTCQTTCMDYKMPCDSDNPCCDSSQKCVQNPQLRIGQLYCAKEGEYCGNNDMGVCLSGGFICPTGYSGLNGGEDCPGVTNICCILYSQEGEMCGLGGNGACKPSSTSCTGAGGSGDYPQCDSGLKCCLN